MCMSQRMILLIHMLLPEKWLLLMLDILKQLKIKDLIEPTHTMTVKNSFFRAAPQEMKKTGKAQFSQLQKLMSLKESALISQIMEQQIFLVTSPLSCKEEMSMPRQDLIESL